MDNILDVAIRTDHALVAGMQVMPAGQDAPELASIPHVPWSPDIGRPDNSPASREPGCASELLGYYLALAIHGLRKIIGIAFRQTTRRTDKLCRCDDGACDRG